MQIQIEGWAVFLTAQVSSSNKGGPFSSMEKGPPL